MLIIFQSLEIRSGTRLHETSHTAEGLMLEENSTTVGLVGYMQAGWVLCCIRAGGCEENYIYKREGMVGAVGSRGES